MEGFTESHDTYKGDRHAPERPLLLGTTRIPPPGLREALFRRTALLCWRCMLAGSIVSRNFRWRLRSAGPASVAHPPAAQYVVAAMREGWPPNTASLAYRMNASTIASVYTPQSPAPNCCGVSSVTSIIVYGPNVLAGSPVSKNRACSSRFAAFAYVSAHSYANRLVISRTDYMRTERACIPWQRFDPQHIRH